MRCDVKYKKTIIILFILLMLPFTLKLRGEDFGQHQSLFTDVKAYRVGDILTVIISEQNQASNQVTTKTEKTTKASMNGGPGVGPLRFIPLFDVDGENKSTFDGKGRSVRNNSVQAKMTVTVVAVKENGDLVIEGSRTTGISGDKETIVLTGVVRQKDINPDNTINSYQIADAEIHFTGKGTVGTGTRPGFVTRFFNWLF